mmetsp:Transcript_12663/g.17682  ORF Transcript_12663/g.17682 Transcript_12663/m.17682 type:complete len:214 (+) Transcript_12663:837-1478(+)
MGSLWLSGVDDKLSALLKPRFKLEGVWERGVRGLILSAPLLPETLVLLPAPCLAAIAFSSALVARATALNTTRRACSTRLSRRGAVSKRTSTRLKPNSSSAKLAEIVPGARTTTSSYSPFVPAVSFASNKRGRITSYSCCRPLALGGRGRVVKAVFTLDKCTLEESMLRRRFLLLLSPDCSECRRRRTVQALMRDSTNDLKDAAIFLAIAPGA